MSKKVKDLTGRPYKHRLRGEKPLGFGNVFLMTRAGHTANKHFKPLRDAVTAEKKRIERIQERRDLPIRMRAIANRVCSKPVGTWDHKDMVDLEKYFDPATVRKLQEISDKRFKK